MTKNNLFLIAALVPLITMGAGCVARNSSEQKNSDFNTPSSTSIASTSYTQNHKIVLASDYDYDINTGNLKSTIDNTVIYKFSAGRNPDKFTGMPAVYIFSFLDGSKLILWQTSSDSSQLGPNWEYTLWLGNELQYIDLDKLSQGLKSYVVPESKKQAVRNMLAEN